MEYNPLDMKVVIVGHVDHGKSTIIGRLMVDTDALPEGRLEQVQEKCRRNSKPFEYAFLLDTLKEEQSKGITIDVARCFFKSKKRRYIIMDAPGHIEFLKNMVTGAAQAEAALLIIDAVEGIQLNSLRHGYLLNMLGIKQVVVLINKMDLVNYSEHAFNNVVDDFKEFLHKIGTIPITYIPVSGRLGDNIGGSSVNMPWYQGSTVLEALDQLNPELIPEDKPFRMPVQGVYKFTQYGDKRRIIVGTVEAGALQVGDAVVFNPSGKSGRVRSIEGFPVCDIDEVQAGQAIGFTLEDQIYISRGELVAKVGEIKAKVSSRLRVKLFWLGKKPMYKEKSYFLKLGTAKVRVSLEEILRVMDASTLDPHEGGECISIYNAAECIIKCDKPISFDLGDEIMATGRFVIVDNYEIICGGVVQEALENRHLHWQSTTVSKADREFLNGHRCGVLWFTGLSGSGKSTIANALEKRLYILGNRTYLLDGDNIRYGLNRDLGFSKAGRTENIRRIAEVAKLFADAGMIALTAFISPFRVDRQSARDIMGRDIFLEIYVDCSIEECARRDPKGLYAKARRGEIYQFTGVSDPYESPANPDIIVFTEKESVEEAVERILEELRIRNLILG